MSAGADTPRGLPGPLPEGERILWQGSPDPVALARGALHRRELLGYFAVAAVATAVAGWIRGRAGLDLATSLLVLAGACAAVLLLLAGFAALIARTTVYTITSRRTVMRIGIALPLTLNLPHRSLSGAGLRLDRDGTGDIPLALGDGGRIGFLHLWPHARPWHLSRPEPMLRAVPDAGKVAAILARAVGAGPLGRAAALRAEAGDGAPAGAVPSQAA